MHVYRARLVVRASAPFARRESVGSGANVLRGGSALCGPRVKMCQNSSSRSAAKSGSTALQINGLSWRGDTAATYVARARARGRDRERRSGVNKRFVRISFGRAAMELENANRSRQRSTDGTERVATNSILFFVFRCHNFFFFISIIITIFILRLRLIYRYLAHVAIIILTHRPQ